MPSRKPPNWPQPKTRWLNTPARTERQVTEMNQLSRLMLIGAVALSAYCCVVAAILAIDSLPAEWQGPAWGVLIVSLLALFTSKKARRLFTSGGTAAWASIKEMQRAGMLGVKKGLILGRVPAEGKPLSRAVKALFNK